MIIYKLTFPNGKSYIGQTVRKMQTRLSQHRTQARAGSLLPVHCAWRKHGEPSCGVLGSYNSMDELHAAEIDAIAQCGTLSPAGYNVSYGGDTSPATNPEVSAKISASATGRVANDATREKIAAGSAANWLDPTYREKVRAGVVASWTQERRNAARERAKARKGEKRSEEAKANMRKTHKMSAAGSKAIGDARRRSVGAKRSAETKEIMAAKATASWKDPEIRARRADAIRQGHRRRKERLGETK